MKLSVEEKNELFEDFKRRFDQPKKMYVEICREGVQLPEYAHIGDAGMDIRAAEDVVINSGETKIIPTGLKVVIPEGFELQIRPRSGVSLRTPLRFPNSIGTIDSGYRDEMGIIVTNTSPLLLEGDYNTYTIEEKGNKGGIYQVKKGDRIAQIVLNKFEKIQFEEVESGVIETIGQNRGGGLGHTGTE